MPKDTEKREPESKQQNTCFVIMPISDPEGYAPGHFNKIYTQLFVPAIEQAGFKAHRVDEDKSSDSIQLKILHELIEAPMALCDLSTRNPNVLYELGLRQAFDKPVVLVQEIGTQRIFDINGISTTDYRSGRIYDEIIEDRQKMSKAIEATACGKNLGSIIKLIGLNSAELKTGTLSPDDQIAVALQGIMSDIGNIKSSLQDTAYLLPKGKLDDATKAIIDKSLSASIPRRNSYLILEIREMEQKIYSDNSSSDLYNQYFKKLNLLKNQLQKADLDNEIKNKYNDLLDKMISHVLPF